MYGYWINLCVLPSVNTFCCVIYNNKKKPMICITWESLDAVMDRRRGGGDRDTSTSQEVRTPPPSLVRIRVLSLNPIYHLAI